LGGVTNFGRCEQFKVITAILDQSLDGGQIGEWYERRLFESAQPKDRLALIDAMPTAVWQASSEAKDPLTQPRGIA
jgi:hypothetical protein